jgi:ABC-2 type transporter.
MILFTTRNLKIFLRDKVSVFMSLLAVFIVFGLHVLFLGDVYTDGFSSITNARELIDTNAMAGLLGIASVSPVMGVLGIMISDKAGKISKDFYSSPMKHWKMATGYVFSSFVIGYIMSIITFVLGQFYIVYNGGTILPLPSIFKVLLLLLLVTFSNTALVFFITSFFKSMNAFSTASTVLGTLIGFITGIYLPIGMLPTAVQWIVKAFPSSHGVVLLRQIMLKDALASVPLVYAEEFKAGAGVTLHIGEHQMAASESVLMLSFCSILFFGLAAYNVSKKSKV